MKMNGIGTTLAGGIVVATAASIPTNIIDAGEQLGNSPSPVLLGITSLALVCAVIRLFNMFTAAMKNFNEKQEEIMSSYSNKLEKIITDNQAVMQHCRDKAAGK